MVKINSKECIFQRILILIVLVLILNSLTDKCLAEDYLRVNASEIVNKIESGQPVKYNHTFIDGDISPDNPKIPVYIIITDSIINGSVNLNLLKFSQLSFSRTKFLRDAEFSGCQFEGDISFSGAQFYRDAQFTWATFFGYANFDFAQFNGTAYFDMSDFEYVANFNNVGFGHCAQFSNSHFHNDANFRYSQLKGARFEYAQFDGYADLRHSNFYQNAHFDDVKFSNNAYFESSKFHDDASFYRSNFNKSGYFYYSEFFGNTNFKASKFNNEMNMLSCIFNNNADFEHVSFNGTSFFAASEFRNKTNFDQSNFGNNAYFDEARFEDNAYFNEAQFEGAAFFSLAEFEREANFPLAYFGMYGDFDEARFKDVTNFYKAQFQGDASFALAEFDKDTNFRETRFNKNLNMSSLKFEKLMIDWNSISKDLTCNGPVYLALISNFRELEQFDDADNCYYQYRKWKQDLSERDPLDKLIDHLAWISCGYGVRPGYTLAWCIICIMLFGFLFWLGNGISISTLQINESKSSITWSLSSLWRAVLNTFSQRPMSLPKFARLIKESISRTKVQAESKLNPELIRQALEFLWNRSFTMRISLIDALYFSSMTFISKSPQQWLPRGKWRYAIMIESILGWLLLALFIVTLTKVMIRY